MKSSTLPSLQGPQADLSELHRTEFLDTGISPACLQTGTSQGTKLAKQRMEAEGSTNKRYTVDSLEARLDLLQTEEGDTSSLLVPRVSGCSRARGRCCRTNADRLSRCSCVFQFPGWFTLCFFFVWWILHLLFLPALLICFWVRWGEA